ncbi:MAG: hypothetical protein WAV90_15760 [Gordonia amarae]
MARSNLFGIDGREAKTGLPGISGRPLEPPAADSTPYGEDMSLIVACPL